MLHRRSGNIKQIVSDALDVSDEFETQEREQAVRRLKRALGDTPKLLAIDPDDPDLATDEINDYASMIETLNQRIKSGNMTTSDADADADLQRKLNEAEAEAKKQKDRVNALDQEKKDLQQQLRDFQAGRGNVIVLRKDDDPANAVAILDLNRDEKGNLHDSADVRVLYEEKGYKLQIPGKPPVYYPVAPPNGDETNGNGGTTPPEPEQPTDTTSDGTKKTLRQRAATVADKMLGPKSPKST